MWSTISFIDRQNYFCKPHAFLQKEPLIANNRDNVRSKEAKAADKSGFDIK